MPVNTQYQNVDARTPIDVVLNLDEPSHYQQPNNSHIRQTGPSIPDGIYSVRPDNISQSQHMMQHNQHNMQQNNPEPVVNYENISIESVANNIFPTSASYINALDDIDNPLHGVAISLLGNGNPNCDKTVYIIVIIILAIAIACLLYKMSKN